MPGLGWLLSVMHPSTCCTLGPCMVCLQRLQLIACCLPAEQAPLQERSGHRTPPALKAAPGVQAMPAGSWSGLAAHLRARKAAEEHVSLALTRYKHQALCTQAPS